MMCFSRQLLQEIQKVNFTVNNTHVYFDANGDPSLGYDIVYWGMSQQGARIKTIGEYWPGRQLQVPKDLVLSKSSVMVSSRRAACSSPLDILVISRQKVTAANCSKTCGPGQELKQQGRRCCTDCVPCADGEFSAGNGGCFSHFRVLFILLLFPVRQHIFLAHFSPI